MNELMTLDLSKILVSSVETIRIFAVLVVPGFIMMKIWDLRTSSGAPDLGKQIVEILTCSLFHMVICYPILSLVTKSFANWPFWANASLNWTAVFLYVVVIPFLWPLVVFKARKTKWVRKVFKGSSPTPWDAYFSLQAECFVLVHLKNGALVAGYFGEDSEVSSHPAPQELYLQQVVKLSPEGDFAGFTEDTKGLLIKRDEVSYFEFFKVPDPTDPTAASPTPGVTATQQLPGSSSGSPTNVLN